MPCSSRISAGGKMMSVVMPTTIVRAAIRLRAAATQGVRLINLEKRNDQIGSVCKVMTESLEDEIPEEEVEGTIVSDPNTDAPDIDNDDTSDVNENERNNIEE